jgi:AcrR family transcriptional regulator
MAAEAARAGRKRDHSRDSVILEATLLVLADTGYDGLTIDKVAARAGAARATVYRRWPTKADLVLAAVEQLSGGDVDLDALPDTGSLRDDMAAMILTETEEEQQFRTTVMTGLLSLSFTDEPRLAEAATGAGVGPWIEAIEVLMRRAVERGEFPVADVGDIGVLAQVVPMLCIARAMQHQPITREFSLAMIDQVIIPALRGHR